MAAGFATLAMLAAWRGRWTAATAFLVLAAAMGIAGVSVPERLGPVERAWNRVGEVVGRVTSPVIFALLYYLVITPAGLVRRLVGRSPLARSPSAPTYWHRRAEMPPSEARDALKHLF